MTEGGGSLGLRLRSPVPLVAWAAPHAIPTGPRQVFAHFQTNESKIGNRINQSQGACKTQRFLAQGSFNLGNGGGGCGGLSGYAALTRPTGSAERPGSFNLGNGGGGCGGLSGYAALTRPTGSAERPGSFNLGNGGGGCGGLSGYGANPTYGICGIQFGQWRGGCGGCRVTLR